MALLTQLAVRWQRQVRLAEHVELLCGEAHFLDRGALARTDLSKIPKKLLSHTVILREAFITILQNKMRHVQPPQPVLHMSARTQASLEGERKEEVQT